MTTKQRKRGFDLLAIQQVETSIMISALPDQEWAVLTDFVMMPSWNPFLKSISGELKIGSRLSVSIAPPGKTELRFRPTVIALRAEREFRWLGSLIFAGIFDGEHYFLLEPMADGLTRFTQGEKFSGFLVPLFRGALSATETGFHAMNDALKTRTEDIATANDGAQLE